MRYQDTINHARLADYFRKTAAARALFPGWFAERKQRGLQLLENLFKIQKSKRKSK